MHFGPIPSPPHEAQNRSVEMLIETSSHMKPKNRGVSKTSLFVLHNLYGELITKELCDSESHWPVSLARKGVESD